jgi:hypothetical protein
MATSTDEKPLAWPVDSDDSFYDQFPNVDKALGAFYMDDGDTLVLLDDRQLRAACEVLIDSARLELAHGGSNDIIGFVKTHDAKAFDLIKEGDKDSAVRRFYAHWKAKLADVAANTHK